MYVKLFSLLLLSLWYVPAFADWTLREDQSEIHFASVKNDVIPELHSFTKMSGAMSTSGAVAVSIDLSSVETGIPIRNERMIKHLFDVVNFPTATVSAQIEMDKFKALSIGETARFSEGVTLSLHGKSKKISADLLVSKQKNKRFQVVSAKPILLSVSDFSLVPGLSKLQEIAGLNSIDMVVPVTLVLVFESKSQP